VSASQVNGLRFGIGGRLMDISQPDEFLPEVHVFYICDAKRPNLIVTSRFADGGGAFVAQGPLQPKSGINVGASITAMMSDQFLLTGSYDFEGKANFTSHSASVKFRWLF
jgi:outer membrane autotransporter protein